MRRKSSRLQLFIILISLLGVLSILGYQWYRQTQENKYLAEVEEIQARANKKIVAINEDLELFQATPQVAKEILPKFKEAEKILRENFRKLQQVKPLPKFRRLHRNLLELYLKSANLSKDLTKIANYITEREKLFKKLANDSETFDKKIKEATSDEEVIAAAKLLRESANNVLKKLPNLGAPLKIYSSQKLEEYLKELSQSLELLEQSIEQKNIERVEAAASQLNQVFSKDWSQALLELESQELKKYHERVKEINHLKNKVTQDISRFEPE